MVGRKKGFLTDSQKKTLRQNSKDSNYRKELSHARSKAVEAVKDLKFISENDPVTCERLIPELFSLIKHYLEQGKIDPAARMRYRYDGAQHMLRTRKGLPTQIKEDLKARGHSDIAKLFDGKEMPKTAGKFQRDNQAKFVYDLLLLIHQQMLKKPGYPFPEDSKRTVVITESSISSQGNFKVWWKHEADKEMPMIDFGEVLTYQPSVEEREKALRATRKKQGCLYCTLQEDPDPKNILLLRY